MVAVLHRLSVKMVALVGVGFFHLSLSFDLMGTFKGPTLLSDKSKRNRMTLVVWSLKSI